MSPANRPPRGSASAPAPQPKGRPSKGTLPRTRGGVAPKQPSGVASPATTQTPQAKERVIRATIINRQQAFNYANQVGSDRVVATLRKAMADLELRLATVPKSLIVEGAFTPTAMRATMHQIEDLIAELVMPGVRQGVVDSKRVAAALGKVDGLRNLVDMDSRFAGVVSTARLGVASQLDPYAKGPNSTVLRRLATEYPNEVPGKGIMERYGMEVIGRFEERLMVATISGKPWNEVREDLISESEWLQEAPMSWAQRIVRTECFTGDSIVSSAMVRAVYRRWYEGKIVKVRTRNGREFSATPNHPMLTERGWFASHQLKVGDNLICHLWDKDSSSTRDEYVARRPATMAEVFNTAATIGVIERRRGGEPDFHGDGMNGDIDIARPARLLEVGGFSPITEPLCHDVFAPTDKSALAFCPSCGGLLPVDKTSHLCGASEFNAIAFESCGDGSIGNSQVGSNVAQWFPGIVSSYYNSLIEGNGSGVTNDSEAVDCGFTSGSQEPLGNESLSETESADATSKGSRVETCALDVELDCIVEIVIEEFAGHIYNLTTPHGYYAINGIYTGNCMGAYNRSILENGEEANEVVGGDMVKILVAGFDDRTGWDSYQVHGQIRRLDEPFEWVTKNGDTIAYMTPPNRPNDREVVVFHRMAWPIPDELKPVSDSEYEARFAEQNKKGSPPERPKMSTVPLSAFGTG